MVTAVFQRYFSGISVVMAAGRPGKFVNQILSALIEIGCWPRWTTLNDFRRKDGQMPIASLFALCTAMVLSYLSAQIAPKIGLVPSLGQLGAMFVIPFLTWTVSLFPLALFELGWRRFKVGKFEVHGRGYLLMVLYFSMGQIFGIVYSKLLGGHRPPVLVNMHFHGLLGYIASAILLPLTIDLIYYWIHRAQHSNAMLWKFHSQHHAIHEINSYNCFHHISEHFVDLMIGVFVSMFVYGYDAVPPFIAVYFGLIGQYNHARINYFDYGKARVLLGDPKFHLSHHLNDKRFIGKNFGGFTAIYDVIFRTYEKPDRSAFEGPYGVDGMPNPTLRSILKFW
jgi:sterol desaturase/sphingolipid hydroxylase (fatty acid hydroxylase superfamily)